MKRLPITNAQRRQIQRRAIIETQNKLVQALRAVLRFRGEKPAVIDAIVTATLRQVTTRSIASDRKPSPAHSPAQRAKTSEAMRASWAKRRAKA